MRLVRRAACAAACVTFSALAQQAFNGAPVDAQIEQAIRNELIPGAVVVIGHQGRIVYHRAYGSRAIVPNREPMTEVAGDAGLTHPLEDEAAFAEDLLRLVDPEERARWSAKALENAKRFSTARMAAEYARLYHSLAPAS